MEKNFIQLGEEKVELDYTLGSLYWLMTKYGDLPDFLRKASGGGLSGVALLNKEFIEAMADMIYAGLIKPDGNGVDTSGWSPTKIMSRIHMPDLAGISQIVQRAFTGASPEVDPSRPPASE
jgi:hypothetical protein